MNNKHIITSFCVFSFIIMVLSACGLGNYKMTNEELPIIESGYVYPNFNLMQLYSEADTVCKVKVKAVEDSYMEKMEVSLSGNANDEDEWVEYVVTPYILETELVLKGIQTDEIRYIQNGGKTDTYIEKPDGYNLTEGMELFVFLSPICTSWGKMSLLFIHNDQVILNGMAYSWVSQDKNYQSLINTVSVAEISDDILNCLKDDLSEDENALYVLSEQDFITLLRHFEQNDCDRMENDKYYMQKEITKQNNKKQSKVIVEEVNDIQQDVPEQKLRFEEVVTNENAEELFFLYGQYIENVQNRLEVKTITPENEIYVFLQNFIAEITNVYVNKKMPDFSAYYDFSIEERQQNELLLASYLYKKSIVKSSLVTKAEYTFDIMDIEIEDNVIKCCVDVKNTLQTDGMSEELGAWYVVYLGSFDGKYKIIKTWVHDWEFCEMERYLQDIN